MAEEKNIIGNVSYDDGRLLFELIDIEGITYADIKCSSRKHGFQYKQMQAVELVCKVVQQLKQQERLEAYHKIFNIINNQNS